MHNFSPAQKGLTEPSSRFFSFAQGLLKYHTPRCGCKSRTPSNTYALRYLLTALYANFPLIINAIALRYLVASLTHLALC